jgi:hypothetical protein
MRPNIKKYAIEFSVIFISITLSFIVEEWRTGKQERRVTNEYLQRLKAELNEKTLQTEKYLDNNRLLIREYGRIAKNFKTREIKEDSLFQYLIESEHSGFFEPELTTWESLKSSGIFGSVKPEIIDSVNSLLQEYKELNKQQKRLTDLTLPTWLMFLPDIPSKEVADKWVSFFKKHNIYSDIEQLKAANGQVDLNKFLNNSIAIDYFFHKTLTTIGIEYSFKSLLEKEKRLIELIEKEIEE